MATAGTPIPEEEVAFPIQRNVYIFHQQPVLDELQGLFFPEALKGGKGQSWEPAVFKGQDQGDAAVNAVPIGTGLHIPQGLGPFQKGADRGDSERHATGSGPAPGILPV
jgi:hypothetical protein